MIAYIIVAIVASVLLAALVSRALTRRRPDQQGTIGKPVLVRPAACVRWENFGVTELVERYLDGQPRSTSEWLHRMRVIKLKDPANTAWRDEVGKFADYEEFRQVLPRAEYPVVDSVSRRRYPWHHNDIGAEAHTDQLIFAFAQIGVPLSQSIRTHSGTCTVWDLVMNSQHRFVLEQESAWSLVAFTAYMPERREWTNRFGDVINLDSIVRRVLDRPRPNGPCAGTHRLYSLAHVVRVHEQIPVVSPSTHRRIVSELAEAAQLLEINQMRNGAWTRDWASHSVPRMQRVVPLECVLVTGHHLEWVLIAPAEVRPSDDCVCNALTFLYESCHFLPTPQLSSAHCPYSHCVAALIVATECDDSQERE